MTKFYCECCGNSRPVVIEDMRKDKLNGNAIWGDVVCSKCKFVIATITVDEPGQYEFVKANRPTTLCSNPNCDYLNATEICTKCGWITPQSNAQGTTQ